MPEELCQKFEALTDRLKLRRAYYLLRYTGQRRSDIVKMHQRQYDGTAIEVVQEKTGIYVWVPAHKLLREHLAETGIDGEYLLNSSRGGEVRSNEHHEHDLRPVRQIRLPGLLAPWPAPSGRRGAR